VRASGSPGTTDEAVDETPHATASADNARAAA